MKNEIEIFTCPFITECNKYQYDTDCFYSDDELKLFIIPECKMPFLVFKQTGDPICRLTFDPNLLGADLETYAKTIREHVRIYRKPLLDRIRDFFGGAHDEQ